MTDEDRPAPAASAELPPLLSAAEAAALVKSISGSALLSILKHPDQILVLEKVFAGFRVDAGSLKNPVVTSRLVAELTRNAKLAESIREFGGPRTSDPPETPKPAPAAESAQVSRDKEKVELLNAERDRLRRDLREANASLRAARAEFEAAKTRADAVIGEIESLRRQSEAERGAAALRDQKLRSAEAELADIRSALNSLRREKQEWLTQRPARRAAPPQPPADTPSQIPDNLIIDVTERLLARHKADSIAMVVDEILRQKPDLIPARRARALIYIARGEKPAALDELRGVFETQIAFGNLSGSAAVLVQASILIGSVDSKAAATLYSKLSRRPEAIADITEVFAAVRDTPIYAMLREACLPPLRDKLFAPQIVAPANAASDLLRSEIGERLSVASIVDRIERNDMEAVRRWRAALANADEEMRKQVEAALGGSPDTHAYIRLLTGRALRGRAIVDASNVARYEMTLMNTRKALLTSILAVRRKLWESRFYPVWIVGDANLPHLIDDRAALMRLVQREEIRLVTSGTVADEVIIRDAKRLDAIVVTNDYMTDWDKDDEVDKVSFSISMTGLDATLYF